ncbi:hypothetical protein GCM10010502_49490 [Kitasatospora aureofaciens]|uniref:Uncharacterized protein n=1 Tax=Kitasatospora aureofaciens TaxID=1894 RepID=A0A8H9HVB9_KITAU|nr:hypothetical protein GCM10010502_49490 [Kitasatospora aureofaciens]
MQYVVFGRGREELGALLVGEAVEDAAHHDAEGSGGHAQTIGRRSGGPPMRFRGRGAPKVEGGGLGDGRVVSEGGGSDACGRGLGGEHRCDVESVPRLRGESRFQQVSTVEEPTSGVRA